MMEGLSHEAASLAGHLKLDNLCWIYDNNGITIEGHTSLAFSEDVARRFTAYGWNVIRVGDANDLALLDRAYQDAQRMRGCPTLIIVDSHIGYGAPNKQDSHSAHGEPLGAEEIKLTKRFYGWPEDAQFLVPEGVADHFSKTMGARGASLRAQWTETLARYRAAHPDLARELDLVQQRQLPEGWDTNLPSFPADAKGLAGRDASQKTLNALAQKVPWLMGGSADLAHENAPDFRGRGRLLGREPRRPQLPLRHSRARHGRGDQRDVALEDPTLRIRLPHLQRLRQGADPPRLDHGDPGDLRVHPRFHRCG
jgi:transketolase